MSTIQYISLSMLFALYCDLFGFGIGELYPYSTGHFAGTATTKQCSSASEANLNGTDGMNSMRTDDITFTIQSITKRCT